jgi:hypothetical protein
MRGYGSSFFGQASDKEIVGLLVGLVIGQGAAQFHAVSCFFLRYKRAFHLYNLFAVFLVFLYLPPSLGICFSVILQGSQ